ncbi:mitochondrial 54S ribosomal protein uL11m [Ascoidea rubescens DSM 1968]|uniref:Large ribosomal subunit protein uL11m n=1 Tax=Ascoidea rubescens DSM 1968 TaxID=1344418 RepID=A0A1D2VJ24_9ASCO|nr:ribosomal protein L11 [Ascoidea rubescens DSM 1968]ODV61632.1 ribosomal protein L11 [Ascoidea rubescens DSM 1968]
MSGRGAAAANVLVKLIVGAGSASPSPPVGPALGSKGVKAIDFCKEFNARTANYEPNTPIPVVVTIKPDRSFTFNLKSPSTTYLLKKAAGIDKGAGKVGLNDPKIGTVSLKHIYEIAKIKKTDQNHENLNLEAICKSIIATAKSMGVEVKP